MVACIMLGVTLAIATILLGSTALAQSQTPAPRTESGNLVTIATGNKFQQIVPSNSTGADRRALTIQNNASNGDNCWVYVGGDKASKDSSVVLAPGKSYDRYWPFVPSDTIQATCASSSDNLYVEYK
jgi:hypothetical protein